MYDRRVRCFRNAEEIAEYIGENPKAVNQLVADEGLPAWKRNGKGPWRALDLDLDQWLIGQARKFLGDIAWNTGTGAREKNGFAPIR
jgi:hypothetical protein